MWIPLHNGHDFGGVKWKKSVSKEFEIKLKELETKYERHDSELKCVFEAIRKLMLIQAIPHKPVLGLSKKDK